MDTIIIRVLLHVSIYIVLKYSRMRLRQLGYYDFFLFLDISKCKLLRKKLSTLISLFRRIIPLSLNVE